MNRTEKNHEVLKIDLSGATAIGKTTIGVLIANAPAEVFERHGLLIPISVVNAEGDWLSRYQDMDVEAGPFGEDLHLPNLKRVVITDVNKGESWQVREGASLEDIAGLPPHSTPLPGYDKDTVHARLTDLYLYRSESVPSEH